MDRARVKWTMLFTMCLIGSALSATTVRRPLTRALVKRGGDRAVAKRPWRGYGTVVGGMLNHLALGSMASWGNFLTYCPPRLRNFDASVPSTGFSDAALVIPITVFTHVSLQPVLGPLAQRRLRSPALATAAGGLAAALGIYLSASATTLRSFVLLYAVLPGLGLCLGYTTPQAAAWSWFPRQKNLLSGLLLGAFGAGALVFNVFGTALANPTNAKAVNGALEAAVYDEGFPRMIRGVGLLYAALVASGACPLNPRRPNRVERSVGDSRGYPPVAQEGLGIVPSNTHDWRMFIQPHELTFLLQSHGFLLYNQRTSTAMRRRGRMSCM